MKRQRGVLLPLIIHGLIAAGCAAAPESSGVHRAALETPRVDTRRWLQPVADPPARWRRVIEHRDDVIRHRFVRFQRPDAWPSPRSQFVVHPFPDVSLELRVRRAGPIANSAYSWFGVVDGDPLGWVGFVGRKNGRVAASIDANGRRFEIVNVDAGAYAVLELRPRAAFECGFESAGEEG